MFKHVKHTKEYQKELVRSPYFWVGVSLIAVGMISSFTGLIKSIFTNLILLIAGLFFVFTTKYRILGRLDERHK